MDEALSAFIGALAGSVLTLFFARRTAFDQALGQRVAERRIELLEALSSAVEDTLSILDDMAGAPISTGKRDLRDVFDDFMKLDHHTQLYFSDELTESVWPFKNWLYAELDSGGFTINETPKPSSASTAKVRAMLAEAVEGKHQRRMPWYRGLL